MNNLIYAYNLFYNSSGPDIADISRIFCEVIRSELNANTMHEFVINQKTCNQNSNNGTEQQQFDLQQRLEAKCKR